MTGRHHGQGGPREQLARRLSRDLPDAERTDALARLEPFDDVTRALELAGEHERALEQGACEPVPGEEQALAALASALRAPAATSEGTRRRPRRLGVALAAAAAVVALLFLARQRESTNGDVPDGLFVGTSAYRALRPVGAVEDFGTFRWDGSLPPNGFYQVAVWGAGDPVGAEPRTLSGELVEPVWMPDPPASDGWPNEIRWQVRVYEWSRTQIDDAVAFARRSAR